MGNDIAQTGESSRRLHIDRKMIGILSLFAVLGVCMVIGIISATNTLSALRGFASLQTHWTEARKEASLQLGNYLRSGEEQYYTRFDSALQLIRSAREIRQKLLKDNYNRRAVRSYFLEIHTIPGDVESMITTFERFHNFSDFKDAIQQWIVSDRLIRDMEQLASGSRQQMEDETYGSDTSEHAVAEAGKIDRALTRAQYRLAADLSSGTRFLNLVIIWISSSLGFILLATGGFLSLRFLKSLKSWRRAIEISEQQYRSLFEQNPNAVYSISRDGRFLSGNQVLATMTGYSLEELKREKFTRFVETSQLEKVSGHFQRALEGTPQSYETVGIRKNGEHIHAEITNLPIYVDNRIVGVYGIAQNITQRKENERRIKEQLEEKTHLLSEIHDRVKNNLALMSSLIQLQLDLVEDQKFKTYMDSTVSRIHSMSMVHERLYHNESFSSIRMDEYVREYADSVAKSLDISSKNGELVLHTAPVKLNMNQAIPVALLLNELLTNACKYGIEGRGGGHVKLSMYRENEHVVLRVADNGPGVPDKYDLEEPNTLGLRLVNVLIKQLQATCTLNRDDGTSYLIRFSSEQKLSRIA